MPDMERFTRALKIRMAKEGRHKMSEGEIRASHRAIDRTRWEAVIIITVFAVGGVIGLVSFWI